MDYKLSICVITMNRAAQLQEALESCLACNLPKETEFVIIDNASTDATAQAVTTTLAHCGYSYYYEKLPQNLGVGGGRNYAFSKASGEYVYALDDDAVIAAEENPDFFIKAIGKMDQAPDIITLTTQIYDTVWQENRVAPGKTQLKNGLLLCKMFCGGSHFLRKSFFDTAPYLPNKYNYEEIPPSLRVIDSGKLNVFYPELLVIHKPAINKWDWSEEKNHSLRITSLASLYAIKKMMYPAICTPLLWAAMQIRLYRSARMVPNASSRFRHEVKTICAQYPIRNKIKLSTVWYLVKHFGLSAF